MAKFPMTFGYDVPHYCDFLIEAETEEQALTLAEEALKQGRFSGVSGKPCYDNIDGERVFALAMTTDESQIAHLPLMDDLEEIDPAPVAKTEN